MSDFQSGSNKAGSDNVQGGTIQRASQYAETVKGQMTDIADEAKQRAADLGDKAKGVALDAAGKLKEATEQQKNAGAEYASGFASAVRRAAGEFDGYIPEASGYIRMAADRMDEASDAIRQRNLSEMVSGVTEFARKQPTAFMGLTVLAGFALVRLFKSTAPRLADAAQEITSSASNSGASTDPLAKERTGDGMSGSTTLQPY
jgi:ElaB/YqjD/DUF883 family membrane-anchored ribosome-binding protein